MQMSRISRRMRAMGAASVLFGAIDQAQAVKAPVLPPAVEGITVDGTAFVYTQSYEEYGDGDGEGAKGCKSFVQVVRTLATDQEVSYQRDSTSGKCGNPKDPTPHPLAEFVTYLKAHLIGSTTGQTGPLGTKLLVRGPRCVDIKCKGGNCTLVDLSTSSNCKPADNEAPVELLLKRKDGRTYSLGMLDLPMQASGHRDWVFTPYWLPGESLAVLRIKQVDSGMRGNSESSRFQVVKFEPVRVSVLVANDDNSVEGAVNVVDSVRKLGGYHVYAGIAHDPRKDTVVYAAKGFEKDAQKIAATIPDAKLDALTWTADAEIVVALPGSRE